MSIKNTKKDDILIMDNLSSHKVAGIKEILASGGIKLEYLPPYSPDLNPVESMLSKVKDNLRKIPKTKIDELEKAVGESLNKLKRLDTVGWSDIVVIIHNFEKHYISLCADAILLEIQEREEEKMNYSTSPAL